MTRWREKDRSTETLTGTLWIITRTSMEVQNMTIGAWMALHEFPNRWDPARDTITWQVPERDWLALILKYPEVQ